MKTRTFNYIDEMLEFIEELMDRNCQQFAVLHNKATEQWDVSFAPEQPEFVTAGMED